MILAPFTNVLTCSLVKDRNKQKLSNVAVANALQLQAARATPTLSRFNYDVMRSLMLLNLSTAVLAFLLLIHYFTL